MHFGVYSCKNLNSYFLIKKLFLFWNSYLSSYFQKIQIESLTKGPRYCYRGTAIQHTRAVKYSVFIWKNITGVDIKRSQQHILKFIRKHKWLHCQIPKESQPLWPLALFFTSRPSMSLRWPGLCSRDDSTLEKLAAIDRANYFCIRELFSASVFGCLWQRFVSNA